MSEKLSDARVRVIAVGQRYEWPTAEEEKQQAHELLDLRAVVERLREALRKHGRHDRDCAWHDVDPSRPKRKPCTCGLSAALTEEGSDV